MACLQSILQTLSPAERELVRHALFLGVGRSSVPTLTGSAGNTSEPAFLVRNLVGVDRFLRGQVPPPARPPVWHGHGLSR